MCITIIGTIRRTTVLPKIMALRQLRQSSDYNELQFKDALKSAKHVVFISGFDLSTESGIPSLYGSDGHWRKFQASSLATNGAFLTFPSLVWEYYHHRREVAAKAQPNAGHYAIAQYEAKYGTEKSITVITQNVDGLHTRAGTKNLIELHGSLYKTRCIKCQEVLVNNDSPICEALTGKGDPDPNLSNSDIPEKSLPHCKNSSCDGLLRPHIVWYGESLEPTVLEKAEAAISTCDLCLVVGSSSMVFPAAMYAPEAAKNGAMVAVFNSEYSHKSPDCNFYFEGPCATTLTEALAD